MRYCKKCNVIEPISFHQSHRFHGQSNSTTYNWCYRNSSIRNWKLCTDKNYNRIQMLLINHLSNLWYAIRRSSYDAFSLPASCHWSSFPQSSTADSGSNNSSHELYQDNLWFLFVFSKGSQKCNGTEIMIRPLKSSLNSILSMSRSRGSLFWDPEVLLRTLLTYVFISPPLHMWTSMFGRQPPWWWPGAGLWITEWTRDRWSPALKKQRDAFLPIVNTLQNEG
jgi:hypothetical protein